MSQIPGRLITYCTNIHPGNSWEETFAALKRHIPIVKAAVSADCSFPIGLRLSHQAAMELTAEENKAFTAWLAEHDCFVPTINGFPFGTFHHQRIKEQVYLPDWRSSERTDYTLRLANLLASWLPDGVTGSISTVPLGFRSTIKSGDHSGIRQQLEFVLTSLARIFDQTGKTIMLALEPEPGCVVETTDEVCSFFEGLTLPHGLMKHLGICYDCCHQAVEFENPMDSLDRLLSAGIPLAKVQVSSALQFRGEDVGDVPGVDEPCYLHQVVVRRRNGELLRYADLPVAISSHERKSGDQWRCHFHVPLFHAGAGVAGTTQEFLRQFLPMVPAHVLLEVETYTWDVLPAELRGDDVTESIIREIQWLQEVIA